jgi:Xaa-Pro aminopeptidase
MIMIKMSEFADRRKKLMRKIGRKGIMILPSAPELYRNGDAMYAYRQNSDFYYLTGFEEPEAVLVLVPHREQGEYILFNRVRDRDHEIWDGPRAGQEGAVKDFRADQSFPFNELSLMLPELLKDRETIHYPLGINTRFDKVLMDGVNKIRAKVRGGMQAPLTFTDITLSLHEMRLFKSEAEIAAMQKAVDITGKAHVRAMKTCRPGMYEYELEAELLHEFNRHGARFQAYTSIVGAGKNSCILHYIANNQKIAEDDLVLIDAGAEYQNYAADITRTFPASGKFSGEQRAIYELVLAAQLAAIKLIKPGKSWEAGQDAIVKIITEGLLDLKILKGNLDQLIEQKAYLPFYMHKSGHWLGLDVHDVGRYQIAEKWRSLQQGMVFTVEPGIYISADIKGVSERWHNIGVRIEDDVLVTDKGSKVLSENIPKTVADIEALMAGNHVAV